MKDAQVELQEALAREAEAHRLLIERKPKGARRPLREAAERYRRSWELAHSTAYGRLAGLMKAAIIAGEPGAAAAYVRRELADADTSPTAAYALALAALASGDDGEAAVHAAAMRGDSNPFDRAADAIAAIAERNRKRYAAAIDSIVRDFEARSEHLTGVAIADTALCLEMLARERGLDSGVSSPLLPR